MACVGLTTDAGAHNGVVVDGHNDAVVVVDVEDRQRRHPVGDAARRRDVDDDADDVDKTLNRGVVHLFHALHAQFRRRVNSLESWRSLSAKAIFSNFIRSSQKSSLELKYDYENQAF